MQIFDMEIIMPTDKTLQMYNAEVTNDTDDTNDSEMSYCGDEDGALRSFKVMFEALFYSSLFLLGVVVNGLMVTVLLSRRHLLRISEIYLLHLAMADLLLLATLPFSILENTSGWLFGNFLCKLTALVRHLNLLCGSFLLACISVDRYLAIVHAVANLQRRRRATVHLTCASLWLVCLALSVPNLVFYAVKEGKNASLASCSFWDFGINAHNWVVTNRFLEHACFFLPLAVMGYCYGAVAVTLLRGPRGNARQGAMRLALLITLVFCVCWLPYNIVLVLQTAQDRVLQTAQDLVTVPYRSCEYVHLLQTTLVVTKSLGFSHCCLNPFLYAFVGVRFRDDLLRLFSKWGCGRVRPPLARARRSASGSEATSTTVVVHA